MSWPPIRAVPSVGSRMPQSILITVVFPDPFGPRKPKIDPFPTENETWSTAVKAPKRFVNPSTSIIGSGINRESGNQEGYLVKLLVSWFPDLFISFISHSESKHPPPFRRAHDRRRWANGPSRRILVCSGQR